MVAEEMALFRGRTIQREGNRVADEWERLYEAQTAYRPDQSEAQLAFPDPMLALMHLADIANEVGLTSGVLA